MYSHMLNRWWPAVFCLALALLGLAWGLRRWPYESWRWQALVALSALVLLAALFLFVFRQRAYVQTFSDHLRLVTPFLRLNISYKRIRRTSTVAMHALFPPTSISGWRREILQPLGKRTAIVVELNGFPVSRWALDLFLSPFFFKDSTPHFVFLVHDWMRFSTELETLRSGEGQAAAQRKSTDRSILTRLPTDW